MNKLFYTDTHAFMWTPKYSTTFICHRHCCIIYKIYTFHMTPGDIDDLRLGHGSVACTFVT